MGKQKKERGAVLMAKQGGPRGVLPRTHNRAEGKSRHERVGSRKKEKKKGLRGGLVVERSREKIDTAIAECRNQTVWGSTRGSTKNSKELQKGDGVNK